MFQVLERDATCCGVFPEAELVGAADDVFHDALRGRPRWSEWTDERHGGRDTLKLVAIHGEPLAWLDGVDLFGEFEIVHVSRG